MNKFCRDIDNLDCKQETKEAIKILLKDTEDDDVLDLFFVLRDVFGDSILKNMKMKEV
jgi:hypothetical protein